MIGAGVEGRWAERCQRKNAPNFLTQLFPNNQSTIQPKPNPDYAG